MIEIFDTGILLLKKTNTKKQTNTSTMNTTNFTDFELELIHEGLETVKKDLPSKMMAKLALRSLNHEPENPNKSPLMDLWEKEKAEQYETAIRTVEAIESAKTKIINHLDAFDFDDDEFILGSNLPEEMKKAFFPDTD